MFTKKIIWKDLVSGGVPKNAFYQNRIWWMSDKMTCFLFMSTINCFIADGWVIEKKDTHSFLRKRFLRCINWLSCFNAILIITLPIRTNAVILCIIKIFTRKGPWVKNGAFSKHSKYLTQWAVIFRFQNNWLLSLCQQYDYGLPTDFHKTNSMSTYDHLY